MGSPVTNIQSSYLSLLSDIGANPAASQPSGSPLGFFSQFMNDAAADAASELSQPASAPAASETAPAAPSVAPAVGQTTAPAPKTIQVQFDMNPGAMHGRPIAPEGSSETGQWAILPDGSYFSPSDVSASGLATLHAPPAGWQNTATGQTLENLLGVLG